ncbi:unnamed protein product, partial [Arabidopsis halleri]
IKVKVNCHHSGLFKIDGGVLVYADGVVEVLQVDSITIFQDVVLHLLEKRIKNIGRMWYKLPFEDLSDRQPLWENVDANKKKLVAKGRWMRELDIFFEKEEAAHDEAAKKVEAETINEDIEVFNHDNYEEQILDEDEVYPPTDDESGDDEVQAERLARRDLPDGGKRISWVLYVKGKVANGQFIVQWRILLVSGR